MSRNRVNEETLARWLEAPVDERTMVLCFIGNRAKRADCEDQRGLANAARAAVMLLSDLSAAAEPEAKEESRCDHRKLAGRCYLATCAYYRGRGVRAT